MKFWKMPNALNAGAIKLMATLNRRNVWFGMKE